MTWLELGLVTITASVRQSGTFSSFLLIQSVVRVRISVRVKVRVTNPNPNPNPHTHSLTSIESLV
jgi:hypothetical protein